MGVAKKQGGKALTLSYLNTHQLISMPDFWEAGPQAFRDAVKPASDAILPRLKTTTNCCTEAFSILVRPVHDSIWDWIAQSRDRGESLDWIVAFITLKRGYRPQPIDVYYRTTQGLPQRLVI